MVRELAPVKPVLPVVRGPHQPPIGLIEVRRRRVLAPGQSAVDLLAFLHPMPSGGAGALEAKPQIGGQPQLDVAILSLGQALVVTGTGVLPLRRLASVVECRLAVEHDLDFAVDATHGSQQHVIGVVVRWCPPVRARAIVLVMPVADQQHVAHDDPARPGEPAGLEDHRPREVAPRCRHGHPHGPDPEPAGVTIEHRSEHARRVDARQAHPLDVAARGNQRDRLTVREEAIVGDRWKRAPAGRCIRRQLTNWGRRLRRQRLRMGIAVGSVHGATRTLPGAWRPRQAERGS